MKRLVLVAAHFPPSNLAAVHRTRLWARYLPEFGWQPTIVTTHWKSYEESLDWDLCELVPADLKIIRTAALPTHPLRLVGDIGIRGFPWHLCALDRLAAAGLMDFLHITIPSNYSALLGPLLHRRRGIPYGIDYIDPWVTDDPRPTATTGSLNKAWLSTELARILEPVAVRHAALITGISPGYYDGMLRRNPHLSARGIVTAAMPYGGSRGDVEALRRRPRPTFLFPPDGEDDLFHVIYAGAMLPRGYEPLGWLLDAVADLRRECVEFARRFRLHFVGTGRSPDDREGYNVRPLLAKRDLEDCADEHPARIPYTDVLNHLTHASAVLVIGSTERHYSPSKTYQAILAERPVFALLHAESTAVAAVRETNAGCVVTFPEGGRPYPSVLRAALREFVLDNNYTQEHVHWKRLEPFSARASAQALATALDEALQE